MVGRKMEKPEGKPNLVMAPGVFSRKGMPLRETISKQ